MKQINPGIHRYYGYAVVMALSVSIFLATSCKKDDDDPKKPVITTIGEGKGYAGDTITITGEYFNNNAEETSVKFGTGPVTILSGTTTSIVVIVPQLAPGTVKVVVKVGTLSSDEKDFTILAPDDPGDETKEIEITGFSPKTIKYDSVLTITGKYFTSDVQVFVNGKEQTKDKTVSSDSTTITVKMASKTYSGEVKLVRGDEEKVFEDKLIYKLSVGTITDFSNLQVGCMAFLDDGTSYAQYKSGLVKLNEKGEITHTFPLADTLQIGRLFLADDKTLYMIENNYAAIFKLEDGSQKIDSLVVDNPKFPSFDLGCIYGDNNGILYVATLLAKGIAKIDITSGTPDVDIIATDSKMTEGVILRGDTIFIGTINGISKFHKNGGTPEYIVTQAEDGFYFSGGGMALYKETRDIFIAGGEMHNLSRLGSNNKIEEFVSETNLGTLGRTTSVAINNEGDLFVTANKIVKIEIR